MRKLKTLKKNYEFKNVLSKGKFYVGRYIILYVKENKKNENYVGIAVGTKVGHAVERNRIKRLIRENYRLKKSELVQGRDIVFLLNKKSNIKELNFWNIKEDMTELFNKANMV